MGSPNTTESAVTAGEASARPEAPLGGDGKARGAQFSSVEWIETTLIATALVGAAAKVLGVLVAPGMRGVASQGAMELTDLLSATFSYAFGGLLVAFIATASFELSRAGNVGRRGTRGVVLVATGFVVALAAPSVVERLHTGATLALALLASVIASVASMALVRVVHTRAVGAVLGIFAMAGVLRPVAWEVTALAGERASLGLYQAGRGLATAAVVVQTLGVLFAAAWLGTRSRVRGRWLANASIAASFGVTYLASRANGDTPSAYEAILRGSLALAPGTPLPYGLAGLPAFLVPATILLALVAVVQRAHPPAVLGTLALALLSCGALDVPLAALAITAAAHGALLARGDARAVWTARLRERSSGKTR